MLGSSSNTAHQNRLEFTCAARLPADGLVALSDLRDAGGIVVIVEGGHAWVRWEPGDERAVRRLMAVPDAALFDLREGVWYPHGRRIPAAGVPVDWNEAATLRRAITPLPIEPLWVDGPVFAPVRLRLVRDGQFRPASALRCRLDDLAAWVDAAPTPRLSGLLAARAGDEVMLLGPSPPPIARGTRFWGDSVLTPLGFRPEPALPESALRGALGLREDMILIIEGDACDAVPRHAFRPLSRAAYRLAMADNKPPASHSRAPR